MKPNKGLEELPSLESLVGSTASCVTQYRFGKTSLFQESLVRYRFGRISFSQESLVGSTAGCESQHRFGRTSLFQVSLEKLHINFLIILWTRYQTSPRSGVDHVWALGLW